MSIELLNRLAGHANMGDRSGYWQTLADAGDDYAAWVLSGIDNLEAAGRVANNYAADVSVQDAQKWEALGQRIMREDLVARQTAQVDGKSIVNLDYNTVFGYTEAAYDVEGVPISAWLPAAPLAAAEYLSGFNLVDEIARLRSVLEGTGDSGDEDLSQYLAEFDLEEIALVTPERIWHDIVNFQLISFDPSSDNFFDAIESISGIFRAKGLPNWLTVGQFAVVFLGIESQTTKLNNYLVVVQTIIATQFTVGSIEDGEGSFIPQLPRYDDLPLTDLIYAGIDALHGFQEIIDHIYNIYPAPNRIEDLPVNDERTYSGGTDNADSDISVGSGGGTAQAHRGDDTLSGSGEADHLYGGYGDDLLTGGAGRDLLVGGARNDAAKEFHDHDGRDTANYADAPGGVVIEAGVAADWIDHAEFLVTNDGFGDEDALISIENVVLSEHDDLFLYRKFDNFGLDFGLDGSTHKLVVDGGGGVDVADYSSKEILGADGGYGWMGSGLAF